MNNPETQALYTKQTNNQITQKQQLNTKQTTTTHKPTMMSNTERTKKKDNGQDQICDSFGTENIDLIES
jgi:hypothetical protein